MGLLFQFDLTCAAPAVLMLLAIDTATRTASVALFDERGVVGETTWHPRENHTRSLIPEVIRLLELCGGRIGEVNVVGAATGPGSFTGLRIGLSAAKGLALRARNSGGRNSDIGYHSPCVGAVSGRHLGST